MPGTVPITISGGENKREKQIEKRVISIYGVVNNIICMCESVNNNTPCLITYMKVICNSYSLLYLYFHLYITPSPISGPTPVY